MLLICFTYIGQKHILDSMSFYYFDKKTRNRFSLAKTAKIGNALVNTQKTPLFSHVGNELYILRKILAELTIKHNIACLSGKHHDL